MTSNPRGPSGSPHSTVVETLTPYMQHSVRRAGSIAHSIHADAIGLDHLLLALMADEDCGAHRVVVHAFADPATLYAELLAMTPGILVVGSGRSLPFSPLGVDALFAARAAVRSRGDDVVTPADLLQASAARVDDGALAELRAAGYAGDEHSPRGVGGPDPGDDPLFRTFDTDSKRLLGQACRAAVSRDRTSIAPAHIVLACLEVAPGLAGAGGLTLSRARIVLNGRDNDESALPPRTLELSAELAQFLQQLPAGAQTRDALRASVVSGPPETQLLLTQQRITGQFLESVGNSFTDPEVPAHS